MLVETSTVDLLFSTPEPGLKNAKLGIEGRGEKTFKPLESPLQRNENPQDAKHGVVGSARKEEKDDLHVKAGDDGVSQVIGDSAPKLMS